MLALETFLRRIAAIALSADEYIDTLKSCAATGMTGGMIYDALHVASARKANAQRIYTWNVRHFQRVAPDLAERMMTP
jgi:predicted nucleic acid-binding protein